MGRVTVRVWILLLGWLWLQPALAQHQLEAELPSHSHHCLICALHLDGKLAIPASPLAAIPSRSIPENAPPAIINPCLPSATTQPIRGPPSSFFS
ncbi:hypothetical protein [Aeromonas molluscorum]|uniref:DUF2946 domain-containing protein n=1 Tax=Aeromonas molluscorum 848 TaxID=1268236 RepID=R1GVR4_9GAMM|nr:hypothetical protein [Aeromonas molluscorum]EOD55680.1 hypothetical protein G113_07502 [Aeromonas molluscorum 848]